MSIPASFLQARFLLVLSIHKNVIRAAMVTRELRVTASAQQGFTLTDGAFDPAEVWYKTKKVIAAAFDIGRTLAREVAGVAVVTDGAEAVAWTQDGSEVLARGILEGDAIGLLNLFDESAVNIHLGNLGTWLLWNLTGAYGTDDYGRARARSPFDAELPVVTVVTERQLETKLQERIETERDLTIVETARLAWARIPMNLENKSENGSGS